MKKNIQCSDQPSSTHVVGDDKAYNNTKVIHLQSFTNVEEAKNLVSDFWVMDTGQYRIILKKDILPSNTEDDSSEKNTEHGENC